jgi:hypothetical protein
MPRLDTAYNALAFLLCSSDEDPSIFLSEDDLREAAHMFPKELPPKFFQKRYLRDALDYLAQRGLVEVARHPGRERLEVFYRMCPAARERVVEMLREVGEIELVKEQGTEYGARIRSSQSPA